MINPKLTIITINLNNLNGLIKTFNSVINQSVKDYQYIIVDGESTDGSIDFLIDKKKEIDLLIIEKDSGIYDAMNKGKKNAKGEYVYFLNSGDVLINIDILNQVSKKLTVKCDYYFNVALEKNNEIIGQSDYSCSLNPYTVYKNGIIQQGVIFFNDKFSFNEDFKIFADRILILERLKRNKAQYYPILLAIYNTEGISSIQSEARLSEKAHFLRRYPFYFILNQGFFKGLVKLIKYKVKLIYG